MGLVHDCGQMLALGNRNKHHFGPTTSPFMQCRAIFNNSY